MGARDLGGNGVTAVLRTSRLEVVRAVAVALLALGSCAAPAGAAEARADGAWVPHTIVGKLEILTGIASPALPVPRRALVLLPDGYDSAQRYPVVYATDGQDLFDAATASGGEELAFDELFAAHPAGIPPLIVVGVERSAQSMREYAPPGSTDGARGDAYVQLLLDVVKPRVDQQFATLPGRQHTVLFGEGAGGLLAVYAAWTRPDVFGGCIALDLPNLEPSAIPPVTQRPAGAVPPRLWIAALGGDVAQRPSSAQILDALRSGSQLTYTVRSPHTPLIVAAAAGLRAFFSP
jgi:hypothetical protein